MLQRFKMPLYEYRCSSCGAVCEILQRADDPPPAACGACGGPMKKRVSAPAIQFKGNGWYITDYAHKHSPPAENTPNGDKPDSGAAKKSESPKEAAVPAASTASSSK